MSENSANLDVNRSEDGSLLVELAGHWRKTLDLPDASGVLGRIESSSAVPRIFFNSERLESWDSGVLTFLIKVIDACREREIDVDRSGLPEGVRRLLELAYAVPEKQMHRGDGRRSLLTRVGEGTVLVYRSGVDFLRFTGECALSLGRFVTGRARYRRVDMIATLQECGVDALPIVSLINILVGLILAFVGAVQLMQFGAQIFVADLVGIAMTREMAAIMTGIIMAGRTGASFAARLGAMTVNEEVDALQTMAISPIDFLVLPRILALAIMMPLLCLYADLLGIVGGLIVGVGMLDITLTQYVLQTQNAIGLNNFFLGIFKGFVFGILVAISGCMRGMQCGRSASAVGAATTSAVVTAIVLIIVTDAVFAVVTNVLGI